MSPQLTHTNEKLAILVPLFNDWVSCGELIRHLDRELAGFMGMVEIFILDDGSTEGIGGIGSFNALTKVATIRILRMRRNLGHQRCICIGLSYVEAHENHGRILVMDSDGEDRPEDARRLLDASGLAPNKVVFARRARRTEGLLFRLGYGCYRWLHRALTGHDIHFGNFSVVPRAQLRSITCAGELWNHFAGCILAVRIPYTAIDTDRGKRYSGKSSMNLQALVIHGLSAISVFSPVAGTRVISAFVALGGLATVAIFAVVIVRLTTNLAIPGWATVAAGLFFLVLVQSALSILTFLFLILGARSQSTFIPSRDYSHFVDTLETVWGGHGDV